MKILTFVKREIVLSIAALLAVCSVFFVKIDAEYINYIDFRTLGILFCLMAVMAGLSRLGFFTETAKLLLRCTKTMRQMVLILVLLCFFFSMLITNDVALMTFVPLAIVMLKLSGEEKKERWMLFTVVMQTIAANLGSMFTPIGNPQNLYIYGISGMSIVEFLGMMLPLTAVSLLLIFLCVMGATRKAGDVNISSFPESGKAIDKKKLALYAGLFLLSLLVVLHVIHWLPVVGITIAAVFLLDKESLRKVDYSLLLTFVALFIFIGNLGRLPVFSSFLNNIIDGNELTTAVLCSQFTSNVPAALLLSGFTDKLQELTLGVNLGGLGTLIASMASLISYKFVVNDSPQEKGHYLASFTIYNAVFLVLLMLFVMGR